MIDKELTHFRPTPIVLKSERCGAIYILEGVFILAIILAHKFTETVEKLRTGKIPGWLISPNSWADGAMNHRRTQWTTF